MTKESELIRTLRSHKGLNALQMWQMRDEAANRIAALEAKLAERLTRHEKLHRRAQVAEGKLQQTYNYIQSELGILRRLATSDGVWPMRGGDVFDGLSRILSALEATPPAQVTEGAVVYEPYPGAFDHIIGHSHLTAAQEQKP